MKTLSNIPKILRLLLLLGFIQAILADSAALPTKAREPAAENLASGDPPEGQDFPAQLDLPIGALPAGSTCGPPVQVVRVLAVPWTLPAPDSRIDRLAFSGLSPPLYPS